MLAEVRCGISDASSPSVQRPYDSPMSALRSTRNGIPAPPLGLRSPRGQAVGPRECNARAPARLHGGDLLATRRLSDLLPDAARSQRQPGQVEVEVWQGILDRAAHGPEHGTHARLSDALRPKRCERRGAEEVAELVRRHV